MSSLSERSVVLIFGVIVIIVTMLMIAITDQTSPLSPLCSPESLLFHSTENKKETDQTGNFQEDYGVWDPTPKSGGAYGSPVPHPKPKVKRYTSLPKSFSGLYPFAGSKRT